MCLDEGEPVGLCYFRCPGLLGTGQHEMEFQGRHLPPSSSEPCGVCGRRRLLRKQEVQEDELLKCFRPALWLGHHWELGSGGDVSASSVFPGRTKQQMELMGPGVVESATVGTRQPKGPCESLWSSTLKH